MPEQGITTTLPRTRDSVRREALAKAIIENEKREKPLSIKEVMLSVGYSSETAGKQAGRTLSSASMREVMEANGLTRDKVSKVIEDAMGARVVAAYKGTARETDAPDHKTRLAAASLYGDFTGEKKRVIESRNLNVDVPKEAVLGLLGIEPME